ncbi:MAG TPA: hypothetical protein VMY37_19710 [Thermoguttaceae bacterium]|nr:hypothetical protein [Thermoguttaceae bacterium]
MARTRKPCPGCGEVYAYRKADEICTNCKHLICAGKLLKRQQQRKFGRQYLLPKAGCNFPYIRNSERELMRSFQDAFFAIAVALSVEPANSQYTTEAVIPQSEASYGCSNCVYLESAMRDSLREIYASVQAIVDGAYRDGKRAGQDFVRGLCDGSVSLAKLNEETMRESTPR